MLAFPTALGFGANSIGGRGGRVIRITNLNDSGGGSLRDALSQTGARIITFDVAGIITLLSPLRIEQPFVTVAGQTVPGSGICLKGYTLQIRTNDVIVRGLRIRVGDGIISGNQKGVMLSNADRVIIDHCSVSWSVDMAMSIFSSGTNITIQNCIINEPLNTVNPPQGTQGMGFATSPATNINNISFVRNIIANSFGRNPKAEVEAGQGIIEYVDNIFYNWSNSALRVEGNVQLDLIGNTWKRGPNSGTGRTGNIVGPQAGTRIYVEANAAPEITGDDQWAIFSGNTQYRSFSRFAQTEHLANAYEHVLANAGARPIDPVDSRALADIVNGTGRSIASQNEVGGWPTYTGGPPPLDTNSDGMPDEWADARSLTDGTQDVNANGYTDVEDYLNESLDGVQFPPDDVIERFYLQVSPLARSYRLPVPFLIHASLDAVSARVVVESEVLTLPFFVSSSDPDLKIAQSAWMPINKKPRKVTATVEIRFSDDTTETLPPVTFTIAKSPNSTL